ncbi:MAG: cation diffusion facilitator family transporter [Rhodothermales bacterium]
MASDHAHTTHRDTGGARLLAALFLNAGITVVQVAGGLLSGSLSLLADAVHNASDAAAIGISYYAFRIAGRKADRVRTFGYRRAETIGALINLVALIVISLFLIAQAVERFAAPEPIDGTMMLAVGGIAFIEDLISAVLLYRDAGHSLNMRSAFLHMLGDTLATVGVMLGSVAILATEAYWVDPLLTVLISLYLIKHSYRALRKAIGVVMESAPADIDYDAVVATMRGIDGVEDVHHVHLWQLDEQRTALEAHIVVASAAMPRFDQLKERIKRAVRDVHAIQHTTLEMELSPCRHPENGVVPLE